MARSIPTFADLGFNDPRAVTPLPRYPERDPAADALGDAGKSLQGLGNTAFAVAAQQNAEAEREKLKRSRIEMALADADATGNFIRWEAAAKAETDPEKLTALTQQLPEFVSRAAGSISDPEARTLWAAKAQERVARAGALAQTKQLGIWQDRWEAGVVQKAEDLVQHAARSDDPEHQREAQAALGGLLGHLEPIHGKVKTQALVRKYSEEIASQRFAWLTANKRYGEAEKYLDDVAPVMDPAKLNRFRESIRPELRQEQARGLVDSALAGAISGAPTPGKSDLPQAITSEATRAGVDPKMALAIAQIESTMGTDLGRRGNIFQLGEKEWEQAGGGKKGDPATDVRNGVSFLKWTQDNLEKRLGRKAEPWEIYMAHQQGVSGAADLLANPNKPAGQVTKPEYIASNGGDPDAPAANFTDKWRDKYLRFASRVGNQDTVIASAAGGGSLPPPREARWMTEGAPGGLRNVPGLDPAAQEQALNEFREQIQGAGPRRTDYAAAAQRIQASDAPQDVKDAALADLSRRKTQEAIGQAEANNDVLLKASREQITEPEIADLYDRGLISAEANRQARSALDHTRQQRQKAEAKAEEERLKVAQLMHRASAAGGGGPPLDPKSKEDRLAIDLHYAQEAATWRPEEAMQRAIDYSARYGMVPEPVQKMIRGGLHSGRPDQAVVAAQAYEQLKQRNPQLLGDIGDEKDTRFAEMILSNNRKGMPPEIAVKMAVDGLKVDKTTREAREGAYDDARGKDRTLREQSDRRWLEGKKDTWGSDPKADPRMMAEFGDIAKQEYIATGDLEAARSLAMDITNRVWGRTRVGAGGERYEKNPPEKHYGIPTLTDEENSAWMNEQLLADIKKDALQEPGNPITTDRIMLVPSGKTTPEGNPAYVVMLKDANGVLNRIAKPDGEPKLWAPDWRTSEEYRRRQEGVAGSLDAARRLRSMPRPSIGQRILEGVTRPLGETLSRGAGEAP